MISKKLTETIEGLIEELSMAYEVSLDQAQGGLIMALNKTSVVESIKKTMDPGFLGGEGR